MQHIVILGYPLSHSISPVFQQAALDYHRIKARYSARPTPPESLAEEVAMLRGAEYLGANVTIPHKESVRAFLDGVDELAAEIGAVNTIVKSGDKILGRNTDATGLLRALRETGGFDPAGKSVVLLGAGGAARAAAFGLAKSKVSAITIANRTVARARALADEVAHLNIRVDTVPMEGPALASACAGADLVVNSTSIGMKGGPAQGESPLKIGLLSSRNLVYDMVYNPSETPLMSEARRAGAQALGGLSMLVFQGAAAFEMWTGKSAPVDVMFKAAERAMKA
ncbi:MAG: shikimate dehydrogenase [SAR202 cluster bacterium]|nr:shikimate dehydrogenase [SAR202 cluster bacterium]